MQGLEVTNCSCEWVAPVVQRAPQSRALSSAYVRPSGPRALRRRAAGQSAVGNSGGLARAHSFRERNLSGHRRRARGQQATPCARSDCPRPRHRARVAHLAGLRDHRFHTASNADAALQLESRLDTRTRVLFRARCGGGLGRRIRNPRPRAAIASRHAAKRLRTPKPSSPAGAPSPTAPSRSSSATRTPTWPLPWTTHGVFR